MTDWVDKRKKIHIVYLIFKKDEHIKFEVSRWLILSLEIRDYLYARFPIAILYSKYLLFAFFKVSARSEDTLPFTKS